MRLRARPGHLLAIEYRGRGAAWFRAVQSGMAIARTGRVQPAKKLSAIDRHLAALERCAALLGKARAGSLRDWLFADRERSALCIARERGHDMWIVRWPPGSVAHPHHHDGVFAAAALVHGDLIDRARRGGRWMTTRLTPGRPAIFSRGSLHQLANRSDEVAYSLHLHLPALARPQESPCHAISSSRPSRRSISRSAPADLATT